MINLENKTLFLVDIEGHELMRKTKREQAQLTANRKNNNNAGRTTPARAIAGP